MVPEYFSVAAGILRDPHDNVLITERLCDGPFNGLWEFPGGKIASGETASVALCRELEEELGIRITAYDYFMNLCHEYSDRTVELDFFIVSAWDGEPRGLEGQRLLWVPTVELSAEILLPADAPVVGALRASAG